MLAPRYCRVMITSVIPCRRSRRRTCSMQGRPTTGTSGLGRRLVSGRSRLPSPPAITTAFIGACPDSLCISRPAQLPLSLPRSYGEAALPAEEQPEQEGDQERRPDGHRRSSSELGCVDGRGVAGRLRERLEPVQEDGS